MESSINTNRVINCDRVLNQRLLKEELKCRICLGILRDPKECKVCETCFCNKCLDEWLKNTYKCPLKCSDEPKFKSRPHKIIRNMLSELTLQCVNKNHGCQVELRYDQLQDHENNQCQFEMLCCSGFQDGCQVQLIKRDMEDHESNCQLVPVECEYCKKKVRRNGIRAHWMYCEEAELSCEFCNGLFKKKNYLIHVNALCEEYIMNCGRCSGNYKRKYKEFHDCIRHLQNCQKTMSEEIQRLKDKVQEKDRKISDLENKFFFEMADLKMIIQKLQDESSAVQSKLSSLNESNGFQQEQLILIQQSVAQPKWNESCLQLFNIINDQKTAQFQLNYISSQPQNSQVFGFVISEQPLTIGPNQDLSSRCIIEVNIQQNISTNFIPMHYIVGAVSQKDLIQLKCEFQTFESIYYMLSPTCSFLPALCKSFLDKMRFSLRMIKQKKSQDEDSFDVKLEIEDVEKGQKQKMTLSEQEVYVFFGIYCSSSTNLSNHKEIKATIY